jgi:hypothetical protein
MNLNLCPHYGFGDYVVCYGLVKELSKRYDKIVLFVKPHRSHLQIENVKRLYSSIENVEINTNDPGDDVFYIGWDEYAKAILNNPLLQCQRFFYDQVGVPFNLMWDNFYFKRDMKKEKEIYHSLGLEGVDYVFLHDDPTRNFIINRKYLPDIRIVHLIELPDISILDTLYLVEKAKEVHMTNTGLVSFVDQMAIKHNCLNYHKYPRPLEFEQPILKLNWKIIN